MIKPANFGKREDHPYDGNDDHHPKEATGKAVLHRPAIRRKKPCDLPAQKVRHTHHGKAQAKHHHEVI